MQAIGSLNAATLSLNAQATGSLSTAMESLDIQAIGSLNAATLSLNAQATGSLSTAMESLEM